MFNQICVKLIPELNVALVVTSIHQGKEATQTIWSVLSPNDLVQDVRDSFFNLFVVSFIVVQMKVYVLNKTPEPLLNSTVYFKIKLSCQNNQQLQHGAGRPHPITATPLQLVIGEELMPKLFRISDSILIMRDDCYKYGVLQLPKKI